MKSHTVKPEWNRPVFFPEWHSVLKLEPLNTGQKIRIERAIISFLAHCRTTKTRASIATAKDYLERGGLLGRCGEGDRQSGQRFAPSHPLAQMLAVGHWHDFHIWGSSAC